MEAQAQPLVGLKPVNLSVRAQDHLIKTKLIISRSWVSKSILEKTGLGFIRSTLAKPASHRDQTKPRQQQDYSSSFHHFPLIDGVTRIIIRGATPCV